MRVLYIDDDPVNAILFVEACRFAPGIQVATAESGQQAGELAAQWQPELLVIDLHLPDTSGIELLPALRLRLGRPELPAYLCTADEAHRDGRTARACGFNGCWNKPLDLALVLSELASLQTRLAKPS